MSLLCVTRPLLLFPLIEVGNKNSILYTISNFQFRRATNQLHSQKCMCVSKQEYYNESMRIATMRNTKIDHITMHKHE